MKYCQGWLRGFLRTDCGETGHNIGNSNHYSNNILKTTIDLKSAAVTLEETKGIGLKNAAILEMIEREKDLARDINNDKLSRLFELSGMFNSNNDPHY
jgi:hypothetical protein